MKNIEIKKIRPEYNIIDIREREKYIKGHIYNARNIPEKVLLNNYRSYLNKSETYYIYCELGRKSRKVCEILSVLGYDVVNMYGGYDTFKR